MIYKRLNVNIKRKALLPSAPRDIVFYFVDPKTAVCSAPLLTNIISNICSSLQKLIICSILQMLNLCKSCTNFWIKVKQTAILN